MRPDLDHWLERPAVRITHRREADVNAVALWAAARAVRISDTRRLGRLVRLRLPGVSADLAYDELFRAPPFTVLCENEHALLAGIVGRIWTVRRDYPTLSGPEDFRGWRARGTVRVLFANWTEPVESAQSADSIASSAGAELAGVGAGSDAELAGVGAGSGAELAGVGAGSDAELAGRVRSVLVSETRISAGDGLARLGLAAVRPLIIASHQLIGSEGLDRAVTRAQDP